MVFYEVYENVYEDCPHYQPQKRLNKLRARKSGCKGPCSVLSASSIQLAMSCPSLQDTVLKIPAWARLSHNDSCDKVTGPEKRSAKVALQAELPRKRSKCNTTQISTDQPNLLPRTGLHAADGSPHDPMISGCNNNNNSRRQRKKTTPRGRTRHRSRDRSLSCSSSRTSSRESRSRRRRLRGILKRSRSRRRRTRSRSGTRRSRRRSKRKVRFSRKITYWE